MMSDLTRTVVGALRHSERAVLDEVLAAVDLKYNPDWGNPNVEIIADHVIAHAMSSQQVRFRNLEARLRELVTRIILDIENPSIENHVAFLEGLKRRAFSQPACVHIFTTNYDLLFELAGAETGVVIETGFVGSVERFFDPQRFGFASGRLHQLRFIEHPTLTVRLIKLHGSISWIGRDGRIFERHPNAISESDRRVMILPRRRKVMDTLYAPHDALFTAARNALGGECKYVASCGFSYGDDHINSNLLTPVISSGRIRLFALCDKQTTGMDAFKSARAFNAGFDDGGISNGTGHGNGTDFWKFSRFVELFR